MKRLLLLILLGTPLSQASETIYITNGEWEPYLSEYSYEYGLTSHIVSEAFKLEDIKVVWGFFPWIRAYQLAKEENLWDASCCWWPREKSRSNFEISPVISTTSIVFFHLKSKAFNWTNFSDLKDVKIGGTLEYGYGKGFSQAVDSKEIHLELMPTDEQNFKKLLHGRIDIFPNDLIVGQAQIRNSLPPEKADLITFNPKGFGLNTLHLIFSNNSKKQKYYVKKFEEGLKKLKLSGAIEDMKNDLKNGKYDKQKERWKSED